MNRRIETALRSKYNFRKQCPMKETNELCAQGYCVDIVSIVILCVIQCSKYRKRYMHTHASSNERVSLSYRIRIVCVYSECNVC